MIIYDPFDKLRVILPALSEVEGSKRSASKDEIQIEEVLRYEPDKDKIDREY